MLFKLSYFAKKIRPGRATLCCTCTFDEFDFAEKLICAFFTFMHKLWKGLTVFIIIMIADEVFQLSRIFIGNHLNIFCRTYRFVWFNADFVTVPVRAYSYYSYSSDRLIVCKLEIDRIWRDIDWDSERRRKRKARLHCTTRVGTASSFECIRVHLPMSEITRGTSANEYTYE